MDYEYVNHSSDIDSIVYGNYFSDGNSYSSIEHLYEENRNVVKERALYMINKICDITD
jgi:predicted nucleotidyltransferase